MRAFYDTTFQLEDQATGEIRDVAIKVRRFNEETWTVFERDFKRVNDPPSNRVLLVRRPDGDEQARDDAGAFTVSDAEIMRRRLAEMSPSARADYDKQDAADEAFAKTFIRDAIVAYVMATDGALEIERETGDVDAIRTGLDLVREFGSRADVLRQLVQAIWTENTLSPAEKKVSRSLSALRTSLQALLPEQPGEKPAAAAEPAESAASVLTDIATAAAATTPSGSEAPTNP